MQFESTSVPCISSNLQVPVLNLARGLDLAQNDSKISIQARWQLFQKSRANHNSIYNLYRQLL